MLKIKNLKIQNFENSNKMQLFEECNILNVLKPIVQGHNPSTYVDVSMNKSKSENLSNQMQNTVLPKKI